MYVGCYDYDYLMVYLGGRGGGGVQINDRDSPICSSCG